MQWLSENLGTLLIGGGLLALVILIIARLRADRRQGRNSCGAHCATCPMSGSCHRAQQGGGGA